MSLRPGVANAAGVPCSITPVLTEANLNTCIAEAPTDNSEFVITIGADFNITTQKAIVANKNITLTSVNPASPATLTRGPSFTGRFFSVNVATPNTTTFSIDSVIFDGNNPTVVANNQLIYTAGTGDAIVNIMGNTVLRNNNTASYGSAIYLTATGSGSSFALGGSTKIINNTANRGGGIYAVIADSMTFVINGQVEISGNTAVASHGGGIYLQGGMAEITGSTIDNNTTNTNGGGVYNSGANIIFSNTDITNNIAINNGGAVYLGVSSTMEATGSNISGNMANNNGGGLYSAGGKILLHTGTIISNNQAVGNGGGIYNVKRTVDAIGLTEIDGASIQNNTAVLGGGVYNASIHDNAHIDDSTSTVIMRSGNISGNTAADGGGVYNGIDGEFFASGGQITNNTASLDGGGVFTEDYGFLFVGASVIFASNSAATSSPTRNPANDAIYATNILGTNWTTPFTQGYNNYDINHNYAPNAPSTGGGTTFSQNDSTKSSLLGCAVIIATVLAISAIPNRRLSRRK